MPAKRRLAKAKEHRITPEVVAAFEAGDDRALRRALGLKPWEWPTLPPVDEESPYSPVSGGAEWWPLGQRLRAELEAMTGKVWE